MKSFKSLREKTLTPAEKKKREEIAKAMERENPGMDMKKKMAIATWQAKKVAEAYEDDEPASPDEASMAMRQLGFIEYAAEEVMDHIKSGKEFPEWMQNKLSKLHGQMESLHSALGDHGGDDEEDDMNEAAKVDEISLSHLSNTIAKSTGTKNIKTAMKPGEVKKGLDDLKKRLGTLGKEPQKEATELDEISKKTLGSYVKKASADVANRSADNARDYATGNRPVGTNKKAMKNMKRQSNINKAIDKLTKESVVSADKKPEKYIKPDGKVGIRMVRVDKKVVDKDA